MAAWKTFALTFYCVAFGFLGSLNQLAAQEVALTFDDLPRHGALPPRLTRIKMAKSLVETLQEWRAPKVYGFINAKKLEDDPSGMEVLELWKAAGFPLGNHTYSHMNLHGNSVSAFTDDIARNEPVLQS